MAIAVILDFDGVIADTNALHLAAWDLAYETLTNSRVERLSRFSGMRTETIASILARESEKSLRPFRSADIRTVKQQLLISGNLSCAPIPGVLDFIALITASKLPWGVASNSNRAFVHALLNQFGIKPPVVVTSEDARRGKPAPDLFWACSNHLGVDEKDRSRVIVFEDSEHGVKAALAASMIPIGIATDTAPAALTSAGAIKVFSNFLQVTKADLRVGGL